MRRYLADTHVLLWFMGGEHRRIGPRARRVLSGLALGRSSLSVSTVSLWEIAMLGDEGRIRLPLGFSAWCDALEAYRGVSIEPLIRGDIEEARAFRALRDPMDRLIAGTALRLDVPLLTADTRIAIDRRLRTIW